MIFDGSSVGTGGGIILVKTGVNTWIDCRGTSPGLMGLAEIDLSSFLFSALVSSVAEGFFKACA